MGKRSVLKKWLACAIAAMSVTHAYCNTPVLIECPSVDALKALAYEASFPYGFDYHTKQLKTVVVAGTAEEDMNENAYALMIYPMAVTAGPAGTASENPETAMRALIDKLQLETSRPMSYSIAPGVSVNVCAYSLPGNDGVTALVYGDYDDGFNDNYGDQSSDVMSNRFGASNKQQKHAQVRNLMMKHMIFK